MTVEIDHLSHSSAQTYLWCPRMWYYRYVEKIRTPKAPPLVFGSAFHNAIESYITACATQEDYEGLPGDHWAISWDEENYGDVDWDDGEEEELYDLGLKMLNREITLSGSGPPCDVHMGEFLRSLEPARSESGALQLEKKVEFFIPSIPVPFVGYIDIITKDGVAGDFKTSSRKWYGNKAHEAMQATAYLLALNQLGMSPPNGEFRYYIFPKTKKAQAQVLTTTRSMDRLFWWADMAIGVWRGIQAGYFPPNPTNWLCPKYCDYTEPCGRTL